VHQFYDTLHGFCPKRRTITAIFEAKLTPQLAHFDQVLLYEVLLDLKKAYDTLDREHTLDILEHPGDSGTILRWAQCTTAHSQLLGPTGGSTTFQQFGHAFSSGT